MANTYVPAGFRAPARKRQRSRRELGFIGHLDADGKAPRSPFPVRPMVTFSEIAAAANELREKRARTF